MPTTAVQNSHLVLRVSEKSPELFSTLLQSGFQVSAEPGDTIGSFLERLPGFTREYILREVQTIFLNGNATDDLETLLSGESPTLAVTTAMPGLAGAIFRKNSPHAPLRTTQQEAEPVNTLAPARVTLKIFTTIGKEMGPILMKEGIDLKADNLHSFLQYRPSLLTRIETITWNGQECTEEEMLTALNTSETIHLSVDA